VTRRVQARVLRELERRGLLRAVGPLSSSLFALTKVSPTSGDREGHRPRFGPILDSYASVSQVWLDPPSPLVVMEVDDAILLFDPVTDNSNIVSF